MPLAVKPISQLSPSTRHKKRALESCDEWNELRAKLGEGLKPYECIEINFTPEQQKIYGMKTMGRTFKNMAQAYIRKLNLQYDVWRYRSEGREVIVIASRGASPYKSQQTATMRPHKDLAVVHNKARAVAGKGRR